MGPIVGIDYGTRRIGVATSDHTQKIAFPSEVLDAAGSPKRDAALVATQASKERAVAIVVGMPLNMDGSRGPQAELAQADLTSGKRRRLRDALAAQVMLQSYLDAQRAEPPPELPQ